MCNINYVFNKNAKAISKKFKFYESCISLKALWNETRQRTRTRWRSEFVKTRSLLKRSFLPTMANQHRRLNSITREKGRTISNPLKRAERRILRTVKEMGKKSRPESTRKFHVTLVDWRQLYLGNLETSIRDKYFLSVKWFMIEMFFFFFFLRLSEQKKY